MPPPPTPRPEQTERKGLSARVVLVVLVVVALLAWGGWSLRERSRSSAAAAASASRAFTDRVVPVLTAAVAQRDVPMWLEGLGTVSAFYTVTVKPQVDGRIDKVAFTEGQHVKKGDLLVQIDPRPYAIQLQSAQANLARDTANLKNAELNEERYKTLRSQNLIPTQQLTDQEANVAQLTAQLQSDQAQIESAKLNLDYARIRSPIDGVIGVRLVDPGNVVHASDPNGLVVVTQLDPIAVFFTLPEDDLTSVSQAMAGGPLVVEARSRDGDKPLGEGKLSVIDNEINQQTATIRLKAIFDNPKQLLWPNQFVKARLRLTTRANAVVVPAAVVQHGPQGTFAYVVAADSTATVRPIAVDGIQGEVAIISRGLSPGEQVVVEGQAQLRPGAKVAARPAASGAAAPERGQKPDGTSPALPERGQKPGEAAP
jgi:multidrug efflux system membrane fusion protein